MVYLFLMKVYCLSIFSMICSELILVAIYFIINLIINIFLIKILNNSIQKILYLMRLKNIFKNYKLKNSSLIYLLNTFYNDKEKSINQYLKTIKMKDIILIGNVFNCIQKQRYFIYNELLKDQYLKKY